MTRGELPKLAGAVAVMLYLGWLLKRGLETGVIDSPGAGASVDRDRHPGLFWLTAALLCVAIAIAALVAITVLARHW